jgi:large subunit ribosomal protein L32e
MGLLNIRRRLKRRKPEFKRQEISFQKMLKRKWRHPRGKHSKLRKHEWARGRLPSPGYGSPQAVRGLDRLGYRPVRVFRPEDLSDINAKDERAQIASGVGKKKRLEILKKAEEMKIKVSNA